MTPLISFFFLIPCVLGIERVYYIGIKEEIWNYAPSGYNLITGVPLENDTEARVFYTRSSNRIGGSYKKALYHQFEDDTFARKLPKDPTLGFLGPKIIGEVGDVIKIHAKNMASGNYSLHPHGLQYLKKSEGALYMDGTPDQNKFMLPGKTATYTWNMHAEYGPTRYDPDCSTYIYHSHINTMRDTYSGLLGPMLVCRKGTLREDGSRRDVDRNYILNFYVIDENLSWYIEDNIKLFCTDAVDPNDPDFQESNTMHAVNGLGYGNLRGLDACEGQAVGWNMFGFGNEVDIHSVQFEKQTVNVSNHRQDTVNLFAAAFKSATMVATYSGRNSLITCRVNDHYSAGMYTSLNVSASCGYPADGGDANPVKSIYIAIEEGEWNYGPSGMNLMNGQSLTKNGSQSLEFFRKGPVRIGGIYNKAIYVGYEDSNFTLRSPTKEEMGLLGPLIAVEIGDVIEVTLKNNATIPFNIQPHGLKFTETTPVKPGETQTFLWTAPDFVSPTATNGDCITYLYSSSLNPVKDTNSGLVGPLLLCKRGTLAAALLRDAYYLLFTVLDENQSHYLKENIATYTTAPNSVDLNDADFQKSNQMHSINGLMYGNLLNISLCAGRETDFHVIGLGTEVDMHTMFASGVNIRVRNENTQVASVFPHTTATTTVVPSATGNGEIKCVVVEHLVDGMVTKYSVTQRCRDTEQKLSGKTRYYFIGVVEESWDYVNGSKVDALGRSLGDPSTPGYTYTHQQDGAFVGSVYKKAMYYQFGDTDFKKKLSKANNMGLLGPVIGGEAGDIIKIVFRNMATRNYSLKPWGAKDRHDPFNADKDGVPPNTERTYEWIVPENAVPPEGQPGCNSWIYRSNVDEVKDYYSGLVGPLLLCRTGSFDGYIGTATYDEDFYLLFSIFDENQSHYLDENIKIFAKADPETFNKADGDFHESNLKHSINGMIYHLAGLNTTRDDDVLWHLIGYGNEVDIHTVHFHAHASTLISDVTTFNDVFNLFPGKTSTVHMRTTEVGTWLLHCHVDDHLKAGMVTTFTVRDHHNENSEGWLSLHWRILVLASLPVLISFLLLCLGLYLTKDQKERAGDINKPLI